MKHLWCNNMSDSYWGAVNVPFSIFEAAAGKTSSGWDFIAAGIWSACGENGQSEAPVRSFGSQFWHQSSPCGLEVVCDSSDSSTVSIVKKKKRTMRPSSQTGSRGQRAQKVLEGSETSMQFSGTFYKRFVFKKNNLLLLKLNVLIDDWLNSTNCAEVVWLQQMYRINYKQGNGRVNADSAFTREFCRGWSAEPHLVLGFGRTRRLAPRSHRSKRTRSSPYC